MDGNFLRDKNKNFGLGHNFEMSITYPHGDVEQEVEHNLPIMAR